jgi:hypothetical protein
VVLQLFDGPRELMPLQTTAVCPIVYELAAHSGHAPVRRALIETSKFYLKLPPATSTHVRRRAAAARAPRRRRR